VGFFDALLGGGKKLKGVAPDRLFAMTTAHVTLQTGLGIESAGSAGIVFQPLATSDFDQILRDAEELLRGTADEMEATPTKDLREAERMNAFFIVPTSVKGAIQTIFSTHPPMEKRIERLQKLEGALQAGPA